MDYFLAICQALGWALAIGAIVGAVAARSGPTPVLLLGAAAGALAGAVSMTTDDEALVGGALVGIAVGAMAATVVGSVVIGAAQRSGGGALSLIVAAAAIVLAALCLLISPIALVALAGLAWLSVARHRRSQRKHEGLRILR